MARPNAATFGGKLTVYSEGKWWEAKKDTWMFGERIHAGPTALNMISEGLCPRGREVPVPAVLQNRPLKPPGR